MKRLFGKGRPLKDIKPDHGSNFTMDIHKALKKSDETEMIRELTRVVNSYKNVAKKDPELEETIENTVAKLQNEHGIELNSSNKEGSQLIKDKIAARERRINKIKNLPDVKTTPEFAANISDALCEVALRAGKKISGQNIDDLKEALVAENLHGKVEVMKKCIISWLAVTDWFTKMPQDKPNPLGVTRPSDVQELMREHFKKVISEDFPEELNEPLGQLTEYLKLVADAKNG